MASCRFKAVAARLALIRTGANVVSQNRLYTTDPRDALYSLSSRRKGRDPFRPWALALAGVTGRVRQLRRRKNPPDALS